MNDKPCDDRGLIHLHMPPQWSEQHCREVADRLMGEGRIRVCACGFYYITPQPA